MASPVAWQTIAPFVVATAGEFAGLAYWRHALDGGRPVAALAALLAGFAVERTAVAWWVRRMRPRQGGPPPDPLWRTAALLALATAVEIAIWYGWRWSAARWNAEIAGVLLFVAIHALHAQEMASVREQPALRFVVRRRTVLFSFVEAVGGTLWLALEAAGHPWWGRAALLCGLTIEHVVQGAELSAQELRT